MQIKMILVGTLIKPAPICYPNLSNNNAALTDLTIQHVPLKQKILLHALWDIDS